MTAPQAHPSYETPLHAWARGVVAQFDTPAPTPPALTPVAHTVQVAWYDQDAPRPKPPYVSLQVISSRGLGKPERRTVTSDDASGVEALISQRREGILEVQAYAPGDDAIMSALEMSLRDADRMDTLRASGVSLERHDIRRRLGLNSSRVIETRSVTEFIFRYTDTRTVAVAGAFASAETTLQAVTRTQPPQPPGGPGPVNPPPTTDTPTGAPFDFTITVPVEEEP